MCNILHYNFEKQQNLCYLLCTYSALFQTFPPIAVGQSGDVTFWKFLPESNRCSTIKATGHNSKPDPRGKMYIVSSKWIYSVMRVKDSVAYSLLASWTVYMSRMIHVQIAISMSKTIEGSTLICMADIFIFHWTVTHVNKALYLLYRSLQRETHSYHQSKPHVFSW